MTQIPKLNILFQFRPKHSLSKIFVSSEVWLCIRTHLSRLVLSGNPKSTPLPAATPFSDPPLDVYPHART